MGSHSKGNILYQGLAAPKLLAHRTFLGKWEHKPSPVSNSRGELKANVALPFILSHRDPRVKSHILSGKQNDFLFPSPKEKLNDANG